MRRLTFLSAVLFLAACAPAMPAQPAQTQTPPDFGATLAIAQAAANVAIERTQAAQAQRTQAAAESTQAAQTVIDNRNATREAVSVNATATAVILAAQVDADRATRQAASAVRTQSAIDAQTVRSATATQAAFVAELKANEDRAGRGDVLAIFSAVALTVVILGALQAVGAWYSRKAEKERFERALAETAAVKVVPLPGGAAMLLSPGRAPEYLPPALPESTGKLPEVSGNYHELPLAVSANNRVTAESLVTVAVSLLEKTVAMEGAESDHLIPGNRCGRSPRTWQKTVNELERLGVVESIPGDGVYFVNGLTATPLLQMVRAGLLSETPERITERLTEHAKTTV